MISNPWRNWGPVGQRVPIPRQMEFEWGYLWAEIDVLAGELNVWLLPEMNGATLSRVVVKMPEKWGRHLAFLMITKAMQRIKHIRYSLGGLSFLGFSPPGP